MKAVRPYAVLAPGFSAPAVSATNDRCRVSRPRSCHLLEYQVTDRVSIFAGFRHTLARRRMLRRRSKPGFCSKMWANFSPRVFNTYQQGQLSNGDLKVDKSLGKCQRSVAAGGCSTFQTCLPVAQDRVIRDGPASMPTSQARSEKIGFGTQTLSLLC
ncbi:hypothetical protein GGR57DRAFT_224619 [Xylariaceae sp. FL1272]|nr:hypothetical protein GGR57DRAFT_224619 [Xylariaceae sp. FL1272]